MKPRVPFCWKCGRTLNTDVWSIRNYHGADVLIHVVCAENLDKEMRVERINRQLGTLDLHPYGFPAHK